MFLDHWNRARCGGDGPRAEEIVLLAWNQPLAYVLASMFHQAVHPSAAALFVGDEEGSIVMNPVRPFHGKTIQRVWAVVEEQLPPEWALVSDVAFPFDDANEFCPDLAVVPAGAEAENRSAYSADLVEFVAEVVLPKSVRRDYELKPRWYASRGIANYLVLDPLKGHAVTMWNPGPGGYQGRDTIPYGPDLTVDSRLGKLVIPTGGLPVDPKGDPRARPQA